MCELVHPDDGARAWSFLVELRTHGAAHVAVRLRHADGRWVWFEISGERTWNVHSPVVVLVGRDITAHKRLEAELLHLQKLDTIGRLTGGVAHDLNNLLTGIAGLADLALSGLPASHPVQEDIREIAKAAARATTLTNQLLTFARKHITAPRVLDLNALVLDIGPLLQRLIDAQIALSVQPDPEPAWVFADADQLAQVLLNLVVNARDAMPGGGSLTIGVTHRTLDEATCLEHCCPSGPSVRLSVSDTGTGIDAASRQRVFEPFFTTKPPGQGTGLGLAICAEIVREHQGAIHISSELDRGTTVTVELPMATHADRVECCEPFTLVSAISSLPTGTETVLLVTDEDVVRKVASQILRVCGYTVLEAANGAAALQIIEQHANAPSAAD
jgi:signal transduction histidine kinase